MVSPNTLGNFTGSVVSILPPEIANQIVFLVQAIGGLFVLYLIFLAIRLYFNYKSMKNIKKMREDIEMIKNKLDVRKKN